MASGTKQSTLTLRVSSGLKERLNRFAALTDSSLSSVAATAVEEYLAWRIPQQKDLEKAIKEADQGKFATEAEVKAVMKKWGYV